MSSGQTTVSFTHNRSIHPGDVEACEAIAHLMRGRSGMRLHEKDFPFIVERLSPLMQENGLDTISDLVSTLKGGRLGLGTLIVNQLMNHDTAFFRDKKPFDFFENFIVPERQRHNPGEEKTRFLSAGCSSGQEPYSLAMVVDRIGKKNPSLLRCDVDILALDLSTPILEQAKKAIYTESDMRKGMTGEFLRDYFRPYNGDWMLQHKIRDSVKFLQYNLLDSFDTFDMFDGILCRNVLCFFDPKTRRQTIEKFERILKPEGFLILGYGETLMGLSSHFDTVPEQRGVYRFVR